MISPFSKILASLIAVMVLSKDVHLTSFWSNTRKDLQNNIKYSTKSFDDASTFHNTSNCKMSDDQGELKVICQNLNFSEISEIIPPETIHLEISNSYYPILRLPFFYNLIRLRTLKLTNNSHRYVLSKAFTGLENLKTLNLSTNHIIVLLKTFIYTPFLENLDLSNNYIINVGTIAKASGSLKELRILTLDHNVDITRILKDSFSPLQNSSLEIISLLNTSLVRIDKGALSLLPNLKILDISSNFLNEEALENVTTDLRDTSIEYFFAREIMGLNGFPYKALTHLNDTRVRHLDIGYNKFFQMLEFPEINSLFSLSMSHCSITELNINIFEVLPNLQDLVLDSNTIIFLEGTASYPSELKRLSVKNQSTSKTMAQLTLNISAFNNLSQLLYFDLSRTSINDHVTRHLFDGLKNLESFILASAGIENIEDYAFETLYSLRELDLQGNKLTRLTNYTFHGLINLEVLVLSDNNITFLEPVYPFQDNNLIYILFLYGNQIESVPSDMFSNLSHLKFFSLYSSGLMWRTEPVLSAASNETSLHMDENTITHITPAMILERIFNSLDFTQRPFNCPSCGTRTFHDFFKMSNFSLILPVNSSAECSTECIFPVKRSKERTIFEIKISESYGAVNSGIPNSIMIIIVVASSILFVLSLAIPCYFFRWYVRYWVFHIRTSIRERRRSRDVSQHYVYDAFVCYNATDTPWVVNHMIPALEGQEPRLSLCIHERDFEVGRLITDNILDAIESSRRVILLLTDSFAKSDWCMFELHLAQHKLFDDSRDALLIIKLKNIDNKLYSKDLRYLERTRTCFTWTDDPVGEKLFWNKIRKFFGKDVFN